MSSLCYKNIHTKQTKGFSSWSYAPTVVVLRPNIQNYLNQESKSIIQIWIQIVTGSFSIHSCATPIPHTHTNYQLLSVCDCGCKQTECLCRTCIRIPQCKSSTSKHKDPSTIFSVCVSLSNLFNSNAFSRHHL